MLVTRILSIDTAELSSGFAIIDREVQIDNSVDLALVYCHYFQSTPRTSKANGLIRVSNAVDNLITLYHPSEVALEVRMPTMQSSAIWRMRTDGVINFICAKHALEPREYYPTTLQCFFLGGKTKSALKTRSKIKTATKGLVSKLFNIALQSSDASDAVTIGLYQALCGECAYQETCRVRTSGLENLLKAGCPAFSQIRLSSGAAMTAAPPTKRTRRAKSV